MNVKKKSLARIIINNSIKIFIISILILLGVVLYFFQKEIMYSSVIYGDLALKNSAQSIEKDNAQFTSMVENMEHSISYQLSMTDKEFIDRSFLIGFLRTFS